MPIKDFDLLEGLVERVKNHINNGYYDNAFNDLRKIAEHISLWYVFDAGLWEEACVGRDGTKYDRPGLANCIRLLRRDKIITRELRIVLEGVKDLGGNEGSHSVDGDKTSAIYYCEQIEKVIPVFLAKFPKASRMSSSKSYESLQQTIASKPSPIVAKLDPVVTKPAPVLPKPSPAVTDPIPVAQKPTPVVNKPASIASKPAPVPTKHTPNVANSSPVAPRTAQRCSTKQSAKKENDKKLNVGLILTGILLVAFICFVLYELFFVNPSKGQDANGNVFSTRLSQLSLIDPCYAKLYDFDNDGIDEVFFVTYEKSDDSYYWGLLKEGFDTSIRHQMSDNDIGIACGIYEYNERLYIGMNARLHTDTDQNNYAFLFEDAIKQIKTHIEKTTQNFDSVKDYVVWDKDISTVSQFKLIYQFPFDGNTKDFSIFKNTVDDVSKQIRDSYK